MSFSLPPRFPPDFRRCAPIAAATAAGLLLSFALFFTLRAWEHRAAQATVATAATQRLELLRESLGTSLESLHALGSLYTLGEPVDRTRFRRFAAAALARRPELQALSWTPRVPAAERARYEAAARAEGFADFQFTERDPATDRMIRARDRPDFYYPVYFIEPLARNRAAFGFDLNARLATLARARDTAQAIATPPIQLMQDRSHEPGFIVYLPLFSGAPPATVAGRRAANTGFVAAVFRIADLVRPALARQPGLRITLRDAVAAASSIAYAAPPADPAPPSPALTPCVFSLPFAGRKWEVTFTATTSFVTNRPAWQSWSVLATGLGLTGLLAGYLLSSLRRNTEIARANAALQAEVAERKRAEETAAAANRAKSDFLASLSHEIRTPLNSILGYTQILERDRSLPTRHRDAVAALANSGHHLLGLLNSILDLSKIEAGRMELQRDVFDPSALVHGLAEMFKPRCAGKRLTLRVACPTASASHVLGDEGKLRQVLINLLGNAIKFTPHGEVYINARPVRPPPENGSQFSVGRDGSPSRPLRLIRPIEFTDGSESRPYRDTLRTGHETEMRPSADHWLFEVIDTGIGLTREELSGLFEPFHQTDAGRRHGGTGLGLAIARGHVELMGGTLDVQSEPGTGTRFHFTLPLPTAVMAPAVTTAATLPHLAPGIAVRALVIDDNSDNRVILARLLADIGCSVAEAATAGRARDIVHQSAPDILFIDVLLAGTTGPELLAMLHADGLPVSTPVLFHTAALLERTQREALRANGADLLAKPFRIEDLCACLRRVPGVRFETPSAAALAAAPEPPSPAELEQIVLPEDLCARMMVAAELHSTTVLKACLEELRQLDGAAVPLADHLRHLLRAYDLAAIARLLHRLRVRPAIPSA